MLPFLFPMLIFFPVNYNHIIFFSVSTMSVLWLMMLTVVSFLASYTCFIPAEKRGNPKVD